MPGPSACTTRRQHERRAHASISAGSNRCRRVSSRCVLEAKRRCTPVASPSKARRRTTRPLCIAVQGHRRTLGTVAGWLEAQPALLPKPEQFMVSRSTKPPSRCSSAQRGAWMRVAWCLCPLTRWMQSRLRWRCADCSTCSACNCTWPTPRDTHRAARMCGWQACTRWPTPLKALFRTKSMRSRQS